MSNKSEMLKVSVCVVTYNQEKYIEECLLSIVNQATEFELEIIVGDDCSTDSTPKIIERLAGVYKNITPILRTKNIGGSENYIDVHSRATGDYVCHCDGDDFWLSGKLNSQVSILNSQPDCNIVWTRAKLLSTDGCINDDGTPADFTNEKLYRGDLIKYMAVAVNSSVMYRAIKLEREEVEFDVLDWLINVNKVGDGYGTFASEKPLTVYRTFVGVSSNGTIVRELILKTLEHFVIKYKNNKSDIALVALSSAYSCFKRKLFKLGLQFVVIFLYNTSLSNVTKIYTYLKEISHLKIKKK